MNRTLTVILAATLQSTPAVALDLAKAMTDEEKTLCAVGVGCVVVTIQRLQSEMAGAFERGVQACRSTT